MQQLFSAGPSFPPEVKTIMKWMLSNLRNNKPKEDSKPYLRNAVYVKELFDGKFLRHSFDTSRQDYDYTGTFEKVKECKGNWECVSRIIKVAVHNIGLAKGKEYLPLSKKFVESITFSTFFEFSDIDGKRCSNFLNFINPPRRTRSHFMELSVEKLREGCKDDVRKVADKISAEHFAGIDSASLFWRNILDFCRWCHDFEVSFSETFSEFKMSCKDGNILYDYSEWLFDKMRMKQGWSFIVKPFHFKISSYDGQCLGGEFLEWLRDGVSSGKFSSLRRLPGNIVMYYLEGSFKHHEDVKADSKKSVVDIDELPIF